MAYSNGCAQQFSQDSSVKPGPRQTTAPPKRRVLNSRRTGPQVPPSKFGRQHRIGSNECIDRGRSALRYRNMRCWPMSALGLGRVKTPTLAAHVETFRRIAHRESQIILRTCSSILCWRISFSTFRRCMSFHTAWVNTVDLEPFVTVPLCPQQPTWKRTSISVEKCQ